MSESVFTSILEEWAERDRASCDNAPEFKTSKKHDRAMKRIFKRYERNTRKIRQDPEIRVRNVRKRVAVAILIIILAVISGCSIVYFSSRNINVERSYGVTRVSLKDSENCPSTIEDHYYLSGISNEFERFFTGFKYCPDSSDRSKYCGITWFYENTNTGEVIKFSQTAKPEFDTLFLEIENSEWDEVEVDGHGGVFLDLTRNNRNYTSLIWDNGDYIFQLTGDLDKTSALYLAESTKLFQDQIVSGKNYYSRQTYIIKG